ncbi:u2 snrnp auxiliary factor large subunit [Anaeramoeba flamelloides]|uniref:U2 snrnp auxiliary factor large subunit n=1 Tax=Anaeramoeba flamelloides TaxID=1746091 RepID=A0ABQ8XCK7_9EUKA|nr:u2 snrnp auxiliary factor large subunit [Anaeramoeba flamelloides]
MSVKELQTNLEQLLQTKNQQDQQINKLEGEISRYDKEIEEINKILSNNEKLFNAFKNTTGLFPQVNRKKNTEESDSSDGWQDVEKKHKRNEMNEKFNLLFKSSILISTNLRKIISQKGKEAVLDEEKKDDQSEKKIKTTNTSSIKKSMKESKTREKEKEKGKRKGRGKGKGIEKGKERQKEKEKEKEKEKSKHKEKHKQKEKNKDQEKHKDQTQTPTLSADLISILKFTERVENIKQQNEDEEIILKYDEYGYLALDSILEYFIKHFINFCIENKLEKEVLFIMHLKKFKENIQRGRAKSAKRSAEFIFETFIVKSSLKISIKDRKVIIQRFSNLNKGETPKKKIFKEAEEGVILFLNKKLRKTFYTSKEYPEILKEIENLKKQGKIKDLDIDIDEDEDEDWEENIKN